MGQLLSQMLWGEGGLEHFSASLVFYAANMNHRKLQRSRKRIKAYLRDNGIPLDTKKRNWPKEMTAMLKSITQIERVDGESHSEYQIRVANKVQLQGRDLVTRTPKWADREMIKNKYVEGRLLTEQTGIAHHVDHVIPIKGNNVCGLHVHENLKVITATENIEKSNRHE